MISSPIRRARTPGTIDEDTVYLADSDVFVSAVRISHATVADVVIYYGTSNPPMIIGAMATNVTNKSCSAAFLVPKGFYYKVTGTNGRVTVEIK